MPWNIVNLLFWNIYTKPKHDLNDSLLSFHCHSLSYLGIHFFCRTDPKCTGNFDEEKNPQSQQYRLNRIVVKVVYVQWLCVCVCGKIGNSSIFVWSANDRSCTNECSRFVHVPFMWKPIGLNTTCTQSHKQIHTF